MIGYTVASVACQIHTTTHNIKAMKMTTSLRIELAIAELFWESCEFPQRPFIKRTFTLFMLASKRNCWTIFFIAMMLDDPDIVFEILKDQVPLA